MLKPVMNVEEVAQYLGFSAKKIYRLVEMNMIPASKVGRQYRFLKDAIDGWLEDNSILARPDWDRRLDRVLGRMRTRAAKANVSAGDVRREIKQVRLEHRESS